MRILLVEDSKVYRCLITNHLKEWGFDLEIAVDGTEAWKLLQKPDAPQLVLLDWVLPGMNGIDLCKRMRERGAGEYTYVVVLTGKGDKQDLLAAMEAGADDYLVKPFDAPELKARLLAGKRIIELQQELVAAKDSLKFAASHDFLTCLWNRSEILGFLEKELARSKREKTPVAVLMVDIDHFKQVNDLLGHLSGDAVIKEVATRLKAQLRIYDGIGRYGGEEFLLVLPGCDVEGAISRAGELVCAIAASTISLTKGGKTSVTVSIGVAVAEGGHEFSPQALLHDADQALYRAKANGRNRVEWAGANQGAPIGI